MLPESPFDLEESKQLPIRQNKLKVMYRDIIVPEIQTKGCMAAVHQFIIANARSESLLHLGRVYSKPSPGICGKGPIVACKPSRPPHAILLTRHSWTPTYHR